MFEAIRILAHEYLNATRIIPLNDMPPASEIIEKADDADLLVLGGGELICRNRLFLNAESWAERVHVPKIIVGCGVNANFLESHVWNSLQGFQSLGLRDSASLNFIRSNRMKT